jgi:protein-L-isoaspartate(D-aspartate) O-methyltransferase
MGGERVAGRRRDRLVRGLRREGVMDNRAVADAFAAVPREVFLADGFRAVDGRWVEAADDDFLTEVYRNDALVTKVRDGIPVSSSSQPSLMAIMLDALDVRPGARVLEIGVGTGYNAALLAALGAEVISVDVQPDVVERAAAALARAGAERVTVVAADGYLGCPDGVARGGPPFDRVIVTVGVDGLSPHWLGQLAPEGFVLAPVFHAGVHPVLCAQRPRGGSQDAGAVIGRGVSGAGFMTAAGPLAAGYPWQHPRPPRGAPLPTPTQRRQSRWHPPLPSRRYHDLAVAAGAWDRRVTHGTMEGVPGADWIILDETGRGGAAVGPDGAVAACGPQAQEYADRAVRLLDQWDDAGEPMIEDWWVTFALSGDARQPIWVPERWTL